MGLFFRRDFAGATPGDLIPPRGGGMVGTVSVNEQTALRHSAVWACQRLRADLVSTMPVDVYRRVAGWQVNVPTPPVLVTPGGERVDITEWLFSSQWDLDRYGNCFGLITAKDGNNLPARIELQAAGNAAVRRLPDGALEYRLNGKTYPAADVWHEKQYTVSGLPVGLSPMAYAAWSIGAYLSAQDFAIDFFGSGTVPMSKLKNTQKTLQPKEADAVKERFKASVANRDVFVTGSDWDYEMIAVPAGESQFIDQMRYGISDICRFYGVPADMIDAELTSRPLTYANVTQRNLQLLTMNIGPSVIRRERALSSLTAKPRYVKLNTDALLRMDPQQRATQFQTQIESRQRAPSECRQVDDMPPFTEAQLAEFDRLFPPAKQQPTKTAGSDRDRSTAA